MPFDAPFHLGPFVVDAEGRLAPGTEGRFPAFSLAWRGLRMDATLTREGDRACHLTLAIRAGRVGSTADAAPSVSQPRRERNFAALRELHRLLPPDCRMEIGADHGVRLVMRVDLPMPVPATGLLTEVTFALLRAAPYLELLAEEGIAPGSVSTWPG